ncbi:hypothetical protein SERLA73DRAFT_71409 [Serpula lacrymans var. lacrymans S7.3]|uniref:Uncharacterized protein n=2 Tax=Serpula lacrymans var. lacrymans TaxID=341189 RepID=F8PQL7_SERL3|nr:uncharacterized protein SERLADRAFT_435785 [Serpula lacrymans var. lacrymans S7.9]EGO02265.1 hypothetical protein SERLA73DRAFT_71409 [Serpula lacrymans var. lacrymans S7.3]EGO28009.1 hypothetical protein SERLADRAFT_435785 [Serpula lacrymans var. lacrymans S7.9]
MAGGLAEHGLVCYNWPWKVLMPGKQWPTTTKPKGISDLTLSEHAKLVCSLQDKGLERLYFKAVPKIKGVIYYTVVIVSNMFIAQLINCTKPVILGVAPPPSSRHSSGWRKFADQSTNRKGKPRQTNASATRVSKRKCKAHTHHRSEPNPQEGGGDKHTPSKRRRVEVVIERSHMAP